MKPTTPALALAIALALPALAACTHNTTSAKGGGGERTISVTSTDDSCTLSTDTAPAGNLVYQVQNKGSRVTEFYLYAEDGLRIVGEVENVGPGLSRDLVLNVPPGSYVPACKPGMAGKGIRSDFTVTGSQQTGRQGAVAGATRRQVETANRQYGSYVRDQTEQLIAGTRRFVAAYKAGNDDLARSLYARTRVHWERIEPVAESFGDLDPRMDLREADLAQGQRWTGWHRIEKDLWPPSKGYRALSQRQRATYADRLLADTETLAARVPKLRFTVDQIGNGAKSLLDEVATGKVTGEEEAWSHTDLYDFQANVDGARVAFEGLKPVLSHKDPVLERQIARRFAALQRLLDRYRVGKDGFVSYTDLSTSQVRALSDAVNALSEPLSRLTAAVAL
ncbi:MAG TPA: iron uptake system protein EfeO [Nocardioidaceae bacterium]|nr:iron uptake system protein EfeO [Nocardioidaceae bacterium]